MIVRRLLLWAGITVLGIVTLFVVNVGVHRLAGLDAAQREAMVTLADVRAAPREGRNAFALLWLMPYDVADADIERLAADDVREANARVVAGRPLGDLAPADRPRLAALTHADPGLCRAREHGCLAHVRSNQEATRALVATQARRLARLRTLEQRDYYHYAFPHAPDMPIPAVDPIQRLELSALALDFIDGDRAEAIAGVCRNIATWRRLRHGTDSLIFSMMAVAYVGVAIDLAGDMLAESPIAEPVPAECGEAFAPIAEADVDFCSEAAGESAFAAAVSDDLVARDRSENPRGPLERALFSLTYDREQTSATRALALAGYCSAEQRARSLADGDGPPPRAGAGPLACAANLVGCGFDMASVDPYEDYRERLLDMAAKLRLGATVLWLRETRDDPRPLAERFAARPEHLRSGTRATGIGDDGRSIWVANLDTRKFGERTTLALAPPVEASP